MSEISIDRRSNLHKNKLFKLIAASVLMMLLRLTVDTSANTDRSITMVNPIIIGNTNDAYDQELMGLIMRLLYQLKLRGVDCERNLDQSFSINILPHGETLIYQGVEVEGLRTQFPDGSNQITLESHQTLWNLITLIHEIYHTCGATEIEAHALNAALIYAFQNKNYIDYMYGVIGYRFPDDPVLYQSSAGTEIYIIPESDYEVIRITAQQVLRDEELSIHIDYLSYLYQRK